MTRCILFDAYEEFDFAFQPSIDQKLVYEFATLAFIHQAANLVFLGPPGVGKSHLAVALAMEAISQGLSAYFVTVTDLVNDLRRAYTDGKLDRLLHHAHILNIRGQSYRLKDKMKAGVVASPTEKLTIS